MPSMFCLGFCREGTGKSPNNTCITCPELSLTCSNTSYSLTCINGYYPQPITAGIQKCFKCMPACKICLNFSYCLECESSNLMISSNSCKKCKNNSRLAGSICSSVSGCLVA